MAGVSARGSWAGTGMGAGVGAAADCGSGGYSAGAECDGDVISAGWAAYLLGGFGWAAGTVYYGSRSWCSVAWSWGGAVSGGFSGWTMDGLQRVAGRELESLAARSGERAAAAAYAGGMQPYAAGLGG